MAVPAQESETVSEPWRGGAFRPKIAPCSPVQAQVRGKIVAFVSVK